MGKRLETFLAVLTVLAAVSSSQAQARPPYEEALAREERLLGADDVEARSEMLFRRQFAVGGVVTGSLTDSSSLAGVPPVVMLEAERALCSGIDLDHELKTGDRFYVRWEQEFTLDNRPVGIGRVLNVELHTAKKGVVAISRFRPLKASKEGGEQFYFADGRAAAPPPIGPPLDRIELTSGFGLRSDPLDQPQRLPPVVAPLIVSSPPPAPERSVADIKEVARAYAGFSPDRGQFGSARDVGAGFDMKRRDSEIDRIMVERRVRAREEAQRLKSESEELAKEAAAPPALRQPLVTEVTKPVLLYMHEGLDLLANLGTPIYAAADGFVTLARPDHGYGNAIRIEHPGQLMTIYGHLSHIAADIEPGRYVVRGEVIGFVGSTGRSTGAHLHFEVHANGKPVDPKILMTPAQLDAFDMARFKRQLALERQFRASDTAPDDKASFVVFGAVNLPQGVQ